MNYRLWMALSAVAALGVLFFTPLSAVAQVPPVLVNNLTLTVMEGDLEVITSSSLLTTDADTPASQIVYQLDSGPSNGLLMLSGVPLSLSDTFTQGDIDQGNLSYGHSGVEIFSDAFTFSVSDGTTTISGESFTISIIPVDDPPTMGTNLPLVIAEGASEPIRSSRLYALDDDTPATDVVYELVTTPDGGILKLAGSPLSRFDYFSQEDIDFELLSYDHDGGENPTDSFVFNVTDGTSILAGYVFNISVTAVDDSPTLDTNMLLHLEEGESIVVGNYVLKITDPDTPSNFLQYWLESEPPNGTLLLAGVPLNQFDFFTQEQIDLGFVTYEHAGGENTSDSFSFGFSDGVSPTGGNTFAIQITPVNDSPTVTNSGLTLNEGATATITSGNLQANDADNSPVELTFQLDIEPLHGELRKSGTPLSSGGTFSQTDIDISLIDYVHAGGKTPTDFFTFSVSDGSGGALPSSPFIITVTLDPPSANAPVITAIADIGNDQGRSILLTFTKSGRDTASSPTPVQEYGAYLRLDPLPAPSIPGLTGPAFALPQAALADGWVLMEVIPANGEDVYNMVVPTLADSTVAGGVHWSVFYVRAFTSSTLEYFDSLPDSGYSLDNLSPGAPQNLALSSSILSWNEAAEADFNYFTVYGSNSDILDGTAVEIVSTTGISIDVSAEPHAYFHVTATDHSGNEGPASTVLVQVGVPDPGFTPDRFALAQNRPNPSRSATTISFTLPEETRVRLHVFDVRGRPVRTLVNESMPPGSYTIPWMLNDDSGRPVSPGMYLYRIEAGGFVQTRKAVVIR